MNAELERSRRLSGRASAATPQDMLEAAVVLEAWAGVPAQRALDDRPALMPVTPAEPLPSRAKARPRGRARASCWRRRRSPPTVLAIALWAAPLADDLGAGVVERALRIALPLTLALQWGLRSRYLGRPAGLLALARHRRGSRSAPSRSSSLPAAAFGLGGARGRAADRHVDRRHAADPAPLVRGLRAARRGGDAGDVPARALPGAGRDRGAHGGRGRARAAARARPATRPRPAAGAAPPAAR